MMVWREGWEPAGGEMLGMNRARVLSNSSWRFVSLAPVPVARESWL